jgi:hypothetical protein
LEPTFDCSDLIPDDILAQRRFRQIVKFVKNGNVIARNTTMADIIQINKKHREKELKRDKRSLCANIFYFWFFLFWFWLSTRTP